MDIKKNIINNIKTYIENEKYIEFETRICKTKRKILGVKTPNLKKVAKQFSNSLEYSIDEKINYIIDIDDIYSFEEILIKGFMIEYINDISIQQRLQILANYIPCIDNWAVCDLVCSALKFIKRQKSEVFKFLGIYFKSEYEFFQRFAVVVTLNFYIDDIYIDKVLKKYKNIKSEKYYSKMAIAWALSKIYVNYPNKVLNYINNCIEDDFIYNMTLQKLIESYKVSKSDKEVFKKMKKNKK